MNFDDQIENLVRMTYAFLEQYNLTAPKIIGIAIVASLLILLGVREMSSWFFKTNSIRKSLSLLHSDLKKIENRLSTIEQKIDSSFLDQPVAQDKALSSDSVPSNPTQTGTQTQFPLQF